MRENSCVIRLLCTVIILFISAGVSFSQEFTGLTAFATIIKPTNSLDEGFGGGASADFRVLKKIFIRPCYEFITFEPNAGTFLCTTYRRHSVSLSFMYQYKLGYAWFPFIDAGLGYYFHKLLAKKSIGWGTAVTKECDKEKLKNGFGYHIAPGIKVQISPRLVMNFIGKMLFYNTKKTRFVDIYGNYGSKSVTDLSLSHFQVSWGITLLF